MVTGVAMHVVDITAEELSRLVKRHYGYVGKYDIFFTSRPIEEPVIELFAGTWIHHCLQPQIDAIREGRLTNNAELLLRLMVKDGALAPGVYRVST
jgi:hypothetical protein